MRVGLVQSAEGLLEQRSRCSLKQERIPLPDGLQTGTSVLPAFRLEPDHGLPWFSGLPTQPGTYSMGSPGSPTGQGQILGNFSASVTTGA